MSSATGLASSHAGRGKPLRSGGIWAAATVGRIFCWTGNHWFASYTLEGDKLSFSAPGSTRKMCAPALMEQEARFLASLSTVERWDFSATEQLRLWPAEGKPLRLWPESK